MRKITALSIIVLVAAFSSVTIAQTAKVQKLKSLNTTKISSTNDLPYKAIYSSSFTFGNEALARKVLKAWKNFDDNTLDNMTDLLADSATLISADGAVIKGKDNFLKVIKDYRGSFSAVKSTVSAWTTLKPTDKVGEEVVCIWGTENDTKADGTVDRAHIHEVWFFNKDGKVFYMRQFTQKAEKAES